MPCSPRQISNWSLDLKSSYNWCARIFHRSGVVSCLAQLQPRRRFLDDPSCATFTRTQSGASGFGYSTPSASRKVLVEIPVERDIGPAVPRAGQNLLLNASLESMIKELI